LAIEGYQEIFGEVAGLLEEARLTTARAVNALMTATYWAIGRRIVEHEQVGQERAGYGDELIRRLSKDLTARFGRGFGRSNLFKMRGFFLAYRDTALLAPGPGPPEERPGKVQTASGLLGPAVGAEKIQTASGLSSDSLADIASCFPLSRKKMSDPSETALFRSHAPQTEDSQ